MDERLKQRLVGAAVLVSLAVIFVPMLLDGAREPEPRFVVDGVPDAPEQDVTSPIMSLEEGEAVSGPAASDADPPAAARRPSTAAPEEGEDARQRQKDAESADAAAASAWAIQLGSFARSQNAVALRDRLRAKGYTAFLEPAHSDEGPVTRVYVGPELRRAQAEQALKKLQGEVELEGIVVRYPGG